MWHPWKGLGGLRREVWILFATMLVNRTGTMVLPFMVLYLTRDLAFGPIEAGLVVSAYGVAALAAAPLSGWMCDRTDPLRIMRWSLLLSGLCLLAFPLARTHRAVFAATLVWSLVAEMFRPANMALLAAFSTPDQRKAAYALNRMAINLGMSVGPALGGFLAEVSFLWLFVVNGSACLISGLVLTAGTRWAAGHEGKPEAMEPVIAEGMRGKTGGALSDWPFILFLVALVPVLLVFFQLTSTLPLDVTGRLGLPESTFGLLFTVNTLIIVALEIPLNLAMAKWSHRWTMVTGCALVAAGFGATGFATGFWSAAATVVVWTFGEMVLFPGSAAFVAEAAPPQRRGQYMGLYTMAFSLAFAAGPALGTLVYGKAGPHALWGGAAALGALSAALMAWAMVGANTRISGGAAPG